MSTREGHESVLPSPGYETLQELKNDLTVAEFLQRHLAGSEYDRLRRSIERMVEAYDAADPERSSTSARRDVWLEGRPSAQTRMAKNHSKSSSVSSVEARLSAIDFGTQSLKSWQRQPSISPHSHALCGCRELGGTEEAAVSKVTSNCKHVTTHRVSTSAVDAACPRACWQDVRWGGVTYGRERKVNGYG
jgi:hypothetical protein